MQQAVQPNRTAGPEVGVKPAIEQAITLIIQYVTEQILQQVNIANN